MNVCICVYAHIFSSVAFLVFEGCDNSRVSSDTRLSESKPGAVAVPGTAITAGWRRSARHIPTAIWVQSYWSTPAVLGKPSRMYCAEWTWRHVVLTISKLLSQPHQFLVRSSREIELLLQPSRPKDSWGTGEARFHLAAFIRFYALGFCFGLVFVFSRQGFSVALKPVLELAFVDPANLKLTEIRLPLPAEYWD